MGFMTPIKANRAYRLQQKGQKEEALKLYEEVFAEGLRDPRYILSYALILIRDGQYRKAKEFLVKNQKAPGMTGSQRTTLLVDYAACCFRLGDIDKGINTLEQQFRKGETGLLYQTLGYLYVEKYDAANRPAEQEAPAEPVTKRLKNPPKPRRRRPLRRRPFPRWKRGKPVSRRRRNSSRSPWNTTKRTRSAWTIWHSSFTGPRATRPARRNGLTGHTPSRTARSTRCGS